MNNLVLKAVLDNLPTIESETIIQLISALSENQREGAIEVLLKCSPSFDKIKENFDYAALIKYHSSNRKAIEITELKNYDPLKKRINASMTYYKKAFSADESLLHMNVDSTAETKAYSCDSHPHEVWKKESDVVEVDITKYYNY